jgi:hypothetical protein
MGDNIDADIDNVNQTATDLVDAISARDEAQLEVSRAETGYCRSSNVIASSSFSVGCLSVDCAPSFRVQSVVVMVCFAFIIAFQIA